jgi:hypothetical protein
MPGAHGIPVVDCAVGERKHDIAEEYLAKTNITKGLFLILVGRARAPVWEVGINYHLRRKSPMPYVNHYSFHILDPDWGHITIGQSWAISRESACRDMKQIPNSRFVVLDKMNG